MCLYAVSVPVLHVCGYIDVDEVVDCVAFSHAAMARPDCQTSSDYILEMIAALWRNADIAGIYTSEYEWGQVRPYNLA